MTRDDGGWGHTGAVTKDTQKETDKLRAAEAQRAAKEEALRRARDESHAIKLTFQKLHATLRCVQPETTVPRCPTRQLQPRALESRLQP